MPRATRVAMSRGALVVLAAIGALGVSAQSVVPSGPNKVNFPENWDKGVLYGTVDRWDTKQYREFYTSQEAVNAARAGQPIPYGTTIAMAIYSVKLAADGTPLKDPNGRLQKDRLTGVTVMQKGKGFGDEIPAPIRNGDWLYQAFLPDGKVNDKANLTACYQCHLPFAKDDYLTNLAKLAGTFPTSASAPARSAPTDVTIAGFQFGPGTIKVTPGQSITFTNTDDSPHQVTMVETKQRSALMLKGQSATLKFEEIGTFGFICGLHPTMKGVVEVSRP